MESTHGPCCFHGTKADPAQRFYLSLYVVRSVSVDELVKKLETGKRITKDSVIRESMLLP